ncbi:hypothetical protein BC940DRAFT_299101 [Gongronella butleri]|nr:hypothetical protein BC940DRAFT_299101 [Gongronella butleri]
MHPPAAPPNSRAVVHSHQIQQHHQNQHFLSHMMLPDMDLATLLGKAKSTDADTTAMFRSYPLLAPALLSIVVQHTLTLSTDELMRHTRVLGTPRANASPPPPPTTTPERKTLFFPGLLQPKSFIQPLNKKQVRVLWESLLDQMLDTSTTRSASTAHTDQAQNAPDASAKREIDTDALVLSKTSDNADATPMTAAAFYERYRQFYEDDEDELANDDMAWYDMPVTGFRAICPLYWMQRQFCKFIITYVVVKYPQLENPCRNYLPICERYRLVTN